MTTGMTDRDKALRRNDFWALMLLLVAAVAAQLAMWRASERSSYLLAVPLLLMVTAVSAWQRARHVGTPLRLTLQSAKLLACVGLLAYFFSAGVIALPQHTTQHAAARPSTTAAIGGILLVVQLVQSSTATSRRDLALGAPAVCAMLTQAGVAAHNIAPAPWFAVALVAMVGGVALVFRGELLEESAVVAAPRPMFVVPSAILQVGAVAAIAFMLAPNSLQLHARPVSHAKAQQPTEPKAGDSGAGTPTLDAHSQAIADPAAGRLDLRVRGPLSNAPVFVVAADAPAYWQGAVYDHYDGSSWRMSGDSARRPWSVDAATPSTQNAPADAEATGAGLQTRTDAVQMVASEVQHVVFAPGRATTYAGQGTVSADGDGNALLEVSGNGPPSSRDYNVVSTKPNPDAPAPTAANLRDPRWLQLPTALPTRVTTLSRQLVGGAKSRGAAIDAVETYLHEHATYNLDAPVPAPGEDSVDSFLFVTHQGFCEQFATAAVVLLRAGGIPSRLVTGYSQGDLKADPGRRVMRGADAHAWIQVWYPGVGWIDSDPTATAVLGAAPGTAATGEVQPSLTAQSTAAPATTAGGVTPPKAADNGTPAPETTPDATAQPTAKAGPPSKKAGRAGVSRVVASTPGGRFGLAALVVVLTALAQWLMIIGRRRAVRRHADRTIVVGPIGGPVLEAYLRLDEALDAMGRGRAPGETARDLRARLGELAVSSVSAAAMARAIDLLERECYGMEPLTERETTAAVDVFRQLLGSLASPEDATALAGAK